LIASLPVKVVIPGHGSAFTDVDQALDRARSRLASFQADPLRHARHAVKVLIKYHVMEVRTQPLKELLAWASTTPYVVGLWERFGRRAQPAVGEWCAAFVMELVSAGALALRDEVVTDV